MEGITPAVLSYDATHHKVISTLSGYIIQRRSGAGGYGYILAANKKETLEKVAIKVVSKNVIKEKGCANILANEINALKILNHSCIPKFIEHIDDDTNHYIVMEYCEGITLWELLNNYRFITSKTAFDIFLSITEVIKYIHSCGVSHGDIKPENILPQR